MTHMELENLVSDYLEGQLDTVRRVEVEAHLNGCPECKELTATVREGIELCRSAEDLEPAPWLVSRIMRATVGERKATFWEQAASYIRPVLHPRVAYAVAMGVFSFSIIINVAGINLRHIKAQDLNPRTWFYQANRNGHLLYARAEKFCYDLKVVYELETRLRQLRQQSEPGKGEEPKQSPPAGAPAGGSTEGQQPSEPLLALVRNSKLEIGNSKLEARNSLPLRVGGPRSSSFDFRISTFDFPVSNSQTGSVSSVRSITQ
ncbi:MAG TPA: zf-HC2 domain-containing protein [Terriglobia bacterium]|nr:zf-HC2 domain-containing protein [Terriglobia bacterium]